MVVKITSPYSLQRALNYNEKKVQKGQAECIHAGSYLLNAEHMNFYQKMERMADLIALNERTKKTNTLHISLNFDPSEKHAKETLMAIAQVYMEKIGFGKQPYLVYRHDDAGHPHMHIVTVTIREDGKRIDTYNIGRNQSEKARKEIEESFKLVKAQKKNLHEKKEIIPANVQKAQYGQAETKRSMQHVLDTVINHYNYASLAEFNAILKQYNLVADRGKEDGRIYKHRGLMYSLLDEKGHKTGIPIKASCFYSKPTLTNLEKKFEENKSNRQPERQKLKNVVDWVLAKSPGSLQAFTEALAKEHIRTVLRENSEGRIYGITFIDFRNKSVFNGSDLGKPYSIAGIQQKLNEPSVTSVIAKHAPLATDQQKDIHQSSQNNTQAQDNYTHQEDLLQQLLKANKSFSHVPADLLKKKRKKRKPNL